VLFTGYYRPIFEARLKPDGEFRYPLHRLPPDLVKDEDGETLGRRTPEGKIVPYWTRGEIMRGALKGYELCWLRRPFEAYVVTVQGSGKLRLEDGSYLEIGYAGNNGYPYRSVAQMLVNDGKLQPEEISLQRLLRYFEEHPEDVDVYLPKNPRYIFFREEKGGPRGSLNVPVTPYRTIATDKSIYPRACLAYLVTELPRREDDQIVQRPYEGFALDQDTGNAIRAAGRCDIFMGTGPEVEALAGRTFAEGRLYYLFLKK